MFLFRLRQDLSAKGLKILSGKKRVWLKQEAYFFFQPQARPKIMKATASDQILP